MSAALPRISVVTPSFNQAAYLEATILSVFGQEYANLEYLIMDGGSTDGSREIIGRYAPRLTFWQSQPDGGQAAAINAGFARVSGDVLCWLNSDDFFLPGTLARVAARLAPLLPAPALLYGHCLYFREAPTPWAKAVTVPPFDAARLQARDFLVQPSTFWTRALWEQNGPLDETLHYAFDWEWYLRAASRGRFVRHDAMLSAYRLHDAHKSGTGGRRRREEILAVVARHSAAPVRACYDFVAKNEHAVDAWVTQRRGLERARLPAAGWISRAAHPALWHLPAGVTPDGLRAAHAMLAGA